MAFSPGDGFARGCGVTTTAAHFEDAGFGEEIQRASLAGKSECIKESSGGLVLACSCPAENFKILCAHAVTGTLEEAINNHRT